MNKLFNIFKNELLLVPGRAGANSGDYCNKTTNCFAFCSDKDRPMDDNYQIRRPGETLDQLTLKNTPKPEEPPKPILIKNPAWRWWAFWRAKLMPANTSINE